MRPRNEEPTAAIGIPRLRDAAPRLPISDQRRWRAKVVMLAPRPRS